MASNTPDNHYLIYTRYHKTDFYLLEGGFRTAHMLKSNDYTILDAYLVTSDKDDELNLLRIIEELN
ncbi:MAG: hypothetical protein ACTSPV_16680 [Candidatus Hodarchaeales archaeon]